MPRDSAIEVGAHRLGRELSRQIQQPHMAEIAAQEHPRAQVPWLPHGLRAAPPEAAGGSIDGPVEVVELVGHCPSCRQACSLCGKPWGLMPANGRPPRC